MAADRKMRFKKIKLSADSEPIDNPNYIDCQDAEEAVAVQWVIEMLNIQQRQELIQEMKIVNLKWIGLDYEGLDCYQNR